MVPEVESLSPLAWMEYEDRVGSRKRGCTNIAELLLRRRAGERHEREDGNENCGVTHGVVLCGNAPRML